MKLFRRTRFVYHWVKAYKAFDKGRITKGNAHRDKATKLLLSNI